MRSITLACLADSSFGAGGASATRPCPALGGAAKSLHTWVYAFKLGCRAGWVHRAAGWTLARRVMAARRDVQGCL